MMFEQAIEMAVSNGIWAVMFICLLMYLLKDSSKREKKYINLVENLSDKLCIIKKIDRDLSVVSANIISVKNFMFSKRGRVIYET